MTLLILRVIETSFSTATQQIYNNRYIHIMPKAKAPKKSGSIMSYFEPVKLPRKLAKLENQDQTTRSAAAAKKTKLKPTPQDEIPSVLNWVLTDTLLKTQYKAENIPAVPARLAVAAFDLDSTLVDTKSHTPFPRNGSDWRWLNDRVKPSLIKLAQYTKNGTHIQDLQSNQKIPLEENQKTQAGLSKEKPDQVQKEEKPSLSEQKPTKDQTQDQEEFQLSEQFSAFLANATQSNVQYIIVIFSNQGGVVTKPDAKDIATSRIALNKLLLTLERHSGFTQLQRSLKLCLLVKYRSVSQQLVCGCTSKRSLNRMVPVNWILRTPFSWVMRLVGQRISQTLT